MCGAENFYLYLYGSDFKIQTDHKPLLGIFKSQRPASARIERWRLRLMSYRFELCYRPGKDDSNPAAFISRHPARNVPDTDRVAVYTNYVISKATATDPELTDLTTAISTGVWNKSPVTPYRRLKDELACSDGLILRGTRLILTASLQQLAIDLAHVGHQSIVRTKGFPGIDQLADTTVKRCLACQACTSTGQKPEP